MKYKKEKYMNGVDAMRDAVHYDQGNVVVIETPAREVCTIHGQNWSNHGDGTITEEEHEIADIICHAPDMYFAIKNMIDKHEETHNSNGEYTGLFKRPSKHNNHRWYERLKEIIEQIEGGK